MTERARVNERMARARARDLGRGKGRWTGRDRSNLANHTARAPRRVTTRYPVTRGSGNERDVHGSRGRLNSADTTLPPPHEGPGSSEFRKGSQSRNGTWTGEPTIEAVYFRFGLI